MTTAGKIALLQELLETGIIDPLKFIEMLNMKDECIACAYSGSDEQAYIDHGCPSCICNPFEEEATEPWEEY